MKRTLLRLWLVQCVAGALACTPACTQSARESETPAGQGGMAAGAEAPVAGSGGISGAGGQAGTQAGAAGQAGGSGGAGGVSGGGSGGTMQPVDAGNDAMAGTDAMSDAGVPQRPLAERVCPAGPFGDPLPPEDQRTATRVQDGFGFLEGPVWIAEQSVLLFSDMDFGAPNTGMGPPARIRRLTLPSAFDVFVESGNSNGLALDLNGDVLACTHDQQTLSRYDVQSAARTTLSALRYNGLRFNSPNDLTVRSDGTVYFTDPNWQLGGRVSETNDTNVYRVTPGGEVTLVTDALDRPNGIALSPDESTLYVGSFGSDILAFTVSADGSVSGSRMFASAGGSTDGFGIDCAGNLYAAGGSAVQVWSAAGQKLGNIAVPEGPTNVAFGGADRRTLYITAQSGLYSIQLLVPGLPY